MLDTGTALGIGAAVRPGRVHLLGSFNGAVEQTKSSPVLRVPGPARDSRCVVFGLDQLAKQLLGR